MEEKVPPQPHTVAEASDHSLLARYRGGQEDAATQLYLRYARRLRALVRARVSPQLARRIEPDDIVQSVFRRFFRQVLKGDYDVPPGEELWGLFLVIALNKIRAEETFHRAGKRDMRLQGGGHDPQALLQATEEPDSDIDLVQFTIEDALRQLSEHQRAMVELRIQGHEISEIAQRTGRSKRTVERCLQDVRSRLRKLLQVE
jgi:RNA polymerase sigma-70 factor (ECF subfamily)